MIQAITLLVIAALVAIDQVIKIAVVNRFAAGGSMDIYFIRKSTSCWIRRTAASSAE